MVFCPVLLGYIFCREFLFLNVENTNSKIRFATSGF